MTETGRFVQGTIDSAYFFCPRERQILWKATHREPRTQRILQVARGACLGSSLLLLHAFSLPHWVCTGTCCMPKGWISELLSCCDTNSPSRNAACTLQLLPTASEFPSELPEGWEKFNAGLKSEKSRQKESVDRERGHSLLGRRRDTSSGKSSSLSSFLTGSHIPRTENPLWCLSHHGNLSHHLWAPFPK